GGSLNDRSLLQVSRFHKIVRKHPPSDRQKSPTRPSICLSEIFAATRYIPLWRFKVSRKEVVVSPPDLNACRIASRPGYIASITCSTRKRSRARIFQPCRKV